jgi:predicted TIM-barrel fold metal-dependent hydrolase
MYIVDSQIHLWKNPCGPVHHRSEPLGPEEAIAEMNQAGIARAINCPPIWDPDAMSLAATAATTYPDRISTMGWFQLTPTADERLVDACMSQPGMVGLRFAVLDAQQQTWLADGKLDWLWRAASDRDIPVALAVPQKLPLIAKLARAFPQLRIAVDHLGAGGIGKVPEVLAHIDSLAELASLANVSVKLSASPGYATDAYPFASVFPYLRRLFDAYGPERLFWGTDISRMPCSWAQCVSMFTEEIPWLKGEALEELMGKAICRWLGWTLPLVQ